MFLAVRFEENICFGSEVDKATLNCIVDAAGLDEFVNRQKNGLDTLIGGEGSGISGG